MIYGKSVKENEEDKAQELMPIQQPSTNSDKSGNNGNKKKNKKKNYIL